MSIKSVLMYRAVGTGGRGGGTEGTIIAYPPILADQLTYLNQGADFHIYYYSSPGFSDLPTALKCSIEIGIE